MGYRTLQKFHLIHPLRSRLSPSWGESKTYPSCQWCFKLNWCACSDATMLHEGGQTIATRNNIPDNKRNVAWCCTKVWRKSNLTNIMQHHATSCNIMQQCCMKCCIRLTGAYLAKRWVKQQTDLHYKNIAFWVDLFLLWANCFCRERIRLFLELLKLCHC